MQSTSLRILQLELNKTVWYPDDGYQFRRESEARLVRRDRRSTQRLFEELRGRGYDVRTERALVRQGMAGRRAANRHNPVPS